MGRLVVNNAISVNGAFEAPQPPPDGWLVLDDDSNQEPLEWNATLLEGDLAESVPAIKDRHGLLFVSGAG
jgi:hypothetical protein